METLTCVVDCIAEACQIPRIAVTPETRLGELFPAAGWNAPLLDRRLEGADAFSVNWTAIAEFVLCLEERFELEVPEREVSGLRGRISDPEMTVIALAALVERYRVA